MCTVSLIRVPPTGRAAGGYVRLASNRDESRQRPTALPPQIRHAGERQIVMPVDPTSDGTWIAVNDAGIAATLLNIYPKPGDPTVRAKDPSLRSRGEIIPSLLAHSTIAEVRESLREIDVRQYPGFRLVITDGEHLLTCRSEEGELSETLEPWDGQPMMWASSGLGDEIVDGPRRALFDRTLALSPDADAQDEYHRADDREASHLAVCMSRPDAHTVSYTFVEITEARVELAYFDAPPNADGAWHRHALPHVVISS